MLPAKTSRAMLMLMFFAHFTFGNDVTTSIQMDSLVSDFTASSDAEAFRKNLIPLIAYCKNNALCYTPIEPFVTTRDVQSQAHFYRQVSMQFIMREEFAEALKFLTKGRVVSQKGKLKSEAEFCVLISEMSGGSAQLDTALYYANEAISLFQHHQEETKIWTAYYSRAMIFRQLRENDRAISDMYLAYDLLKETGNRMNIGFVLYYLVGWLAHDTTDSDMYFEVLEAYLDYKKDGKDDGASYHLEILDFEDKEEGIKVLENHLQDEIKPTGYATYVSHLLMLGSLYSDLERFEPAASYFELAARHAEENDLTYMLSSIYMLLFKAHRAADNPGKALAAYERYAVIKDSLYSLEKNKTILEIQTRFETEVKDRQLAEQNLLIQKRNNQIYLISGGLILFLFSGVWVVWAQRKKSQQVKIISEKEKLITNTRVARLKSESKLLAMRSMIEGQENERARIARDLHDGVGSLLTSVKAHVQQMPVSTHKNGASHIQHTAQLINQVCDEVRSVSHNLLPHSIQIAGLESALEDLVETTKLSGLHCEMLLINIPAGIRENNKVTIYRILQELINNVMRHASATKVLLQLIGHPTFLHIMVEDDGVGMRPENDSDGIGLKNIRARTEFLNGTIEIESQPRQGTSVIITIPLTELQ